MAHDIVIIVLTSTNSCVNLKGELSNLILFPGELAKMNPKSMCIKWPSESSRILPLCLERIDIRLFHYTCF